MGIQVHKVIGYGLTDVQTEKYDIVDGRFNPLGYMMADYEDQEDTWTREGFKTYLKNHENFECRWAVEDLLEWEPYDSVVFDPEFGMKNVLLFCEPKAWGRGNSRYDNGIDYYEEIQLYGQKNRVIELSQGIYPHVFYIDRRTGKRLDSDLNVFLLRARNSIREDGWYRSDQHNIQDTIAFTEFSSRILGFNGYHDWLDNAKPMIPPVIEALCKWLCIFNDDSMIYELKPMIYVYWA